MHDLQMQNMLTFYNGSLHTNRIEGALNVKPKTIKNK